MSRIQPLLLADFYKTGHYKQYPEGTQYVYSNFTPRTSRMAFVDHVVVFGIQYFIKEYLIKRFNKDFFNKKWEVIRAEYADVMESSLGKNSVDLKHIKELHYLGFLPLQIKALKEGTLCPIGVPLLTVVNTQPEFYWLTNYIETLLSVSLWFPITSATTAFEYKKILMEYAQKTSNNIDFVDYQAHDFSMRGQTSVESAMMSSAGHLTSFKGTDTIPSIQFLKKYYYAGAEDEYIGGSIPATEHSVMCAGGEDNEEDTYRRLLTDVYPEGLVSIVSDTWDYWNLLTVTLKNMKSLIMSRNGKLVIRPDSGDPVKIICGDPLAEENTPERLGTIRILWDLFGGKVNEKGYKELDSHIGCIYGDSITLDRCRKICANLEEMGFSSTNVVFGVGSYTYQYVTRDTFGFAMKSTFAVINNTDHVIYKSPKTDNGTKFSAKGLLRVNEDMTLSENVTRDESYSGMLKVVFWDGEMSNITTLSEIRKELNAHIGFEKEA